MSSNNIKPTSAYKPRPFADELRRVFLASPNDLLIQTIAIFAIVLAIFMWIEWQGLNYHLEIWESGKDVAAQMPDNQNAFTYYRTPASQCIMIVALTFVAAIGGGAMMFPSLHSMEKRVVYLTQPVSVSRKFWAQWLRYFLFVMVTFAVSVVVADLLRPIFYGIVFSYRTTHFATMWGYLSEHGPEVRGYFTMILPSAILIGSIFAYGSARWQRGAFAKTFCALFISALVIMLWGMLCNQIIEPGVGLTQLLDGVRHPALFLGSIFILLAILNFTACYLRFKETDVK